MTPAKNVDDLPAWSLLPLQKRDPSIPQPSPILTDLQDFTSILVRATDVLSNPHLRHLHHIKPHLLPFAATLIPPSDPHAWDQCHIGIYTHLATLLHMHAVLWDYRSSPSELRLYLKDLNNLYTARPRGIRRCPASSIFLLTKNDCNTKHFLPGPTPGRLARSWYVVRMLQVAKLLSKTSLIKVHRALAVFLAPDPECRSKVPAATYGSTWIREVRKEILAGGEPYLPPMNPNRQACALGYFHVSDDGV